MRRWQQPMLSLLAGACALLAAQPSAAQSYPGADPAAQAAFGQAVAVVEDQVLVGEPETPDEAGIVHIFTRNAEGQWVETGQITPPAGAAVKGFGSALATHARQLLVGADGAAYLFQLRDGQWQRAGQLALPMLEGEAPGVSAVALADGMALVGSAQAGAVHAFREQAGRWVRAGELTPELDVARTGFGIALATNGTYAMVGAPGLNDRTGGLLVFRLGADGVWQRAGSLEPEELPPGAQYGVSAALRNEYLVVGAMGFEDGTGAAYVFRQEPGEPDAGWELLTRLLPFDGGPRTLFGFDVALGENTVWVGAPRADRNRGALYAFRQGVGSITWDSVDRLTSNSLKVRDAFGSAIAATDEFAAVGVGQADYGAGATIILERGPEGEWKEAARVIGADEPGLAAVTGAAVPCDASGMAAVFPCQNVDLLSFLPVREMGAGRGVRTNDVWGWTDPQTGQEIALVGMLDQVSFVDVTNPENPIYMGRLPKPEDVPGATWRDMKVYRDHMFVVADASDDHGMQIFDLTRLREFDGEPIVWDADARYTLIHSAHNVVINEETGTAFSVGSSSGGVTCGGGLHIIDIREPQNPQFLGCFSDPQTGRASTGYTHDAQCVVYRGPDQRYQGREVCLGANETALSIADVTDRDNPIALARASYPNVGYAHQGWLSEDHRYFYMDDELDEIQGGVEQTRTLVWDVSELDDPQLVAEFLGPTSSSDHNLYVKGNLIFQSNYQSGLRILDASNPTDLREVGYLDTVPTGTNTPGFGGSWSNYPYFESGNVIVTSGHEGLFVVRPRM